ncbi:hypothetical protein SLA2020_275900 [Shorea laevis]
MAAIASISLLRNFAAITARTFLTVKPPSTVSSACLLPLRSRRLQFHASATNNEEAAARGAAANADSGVPTIFDKIIAKEIPSSIVYEDEKVLAFRDINPQAPVHVLVIPKFRDGLTELRKAEARHGEILGQLLYAAKYGPDACQSVYHLHLHVLGGRQMKWPPG